MIYIVKVLDNGLILCSDGHIRRPASKYKFRVGDYVVVLNDLVLLHTSRKGRVFISAGAVRPQESCPEGSMLLIVRYRGGAKSYFCLCLESGKVVQLSGLNDFRIKEELREKLIDLEKEFKNEGIVVPKTHLFHWWEHQGKYKFLLGEPFYDIKNFYEYISINYEPTVLDTMRTCERRPFAKIQIAEVDVSGWLPDMFREYGGWASNRRERDNNMTSLFVRTGYGFVDSAVVSDDRLIIIKSDFDLKIKEVQNGSWTYWADYNKMKLQAFNLLNKTKEQDINLEDFCKQYVQNYVNEHQEEFNNEIPDYPLMGGEISLETIFSFIPIYTDIIDDHDWEINLIEASPHMMSPFVKRIRKHRFDIVNGTVYPHSIENVMTINDEDNHRTLEAKLQINFDCWTEAYQDWTATPVENAMPVPVRYIDVEHQTKIRTVAGTTTYSAKYPAILDMGSERFPHPCHATILNYCRKQIGMDWIEVCVYTVSRAFDYWNELVDSDNDDYWDEFKAFQKFKLEYFVKIGSKVVRLEIPKEVAQLQSDNIRSKFLELHNQARADEGLEALEEDGALDVVAQRHSNDMARNHFFSHTGSDGKNPQQRYDEQGIIYNVWGENIGEVVNEDLTEEAIETLFNEWMQSEGHRANILNSGFTRLGIGYAYDEEQGKWKITCDFADKEIQNITDAEYIFVEALKYNGNYYGSSWGCSGTEIRDVGIAIGEEKILITYAIVQISKELDEKWYQEGYPNDWTEHVFQEEIIARIFAFFDFDGNLLWLGQIPGVANTYLTAGHFEGAA